MMENFYFDTSIWLDFYEKRGKNGEIALKLILKIIDEDLKAAYSDLHIKELKKLNYSPNEISSIFSIAKPKNLQHIHIYREQKEEAKIIARRKNITKIFLKPNCQRISFKFPVEFLKGFFSSSM